VSKGESLPGIPAGGMKSAKINWQLNNAWLGINPYLINNQKQKYFESLKCDVILR
jgi:hypothetical protein